MQHVSGERPAESLATRVLCIQSAATVGSCACRCWGVTWRFKLLVHTDRVHDRHGTCALRNASAVEIADGAAL
jgi:hypothetical protein